ncbi:MAG: AI-2E family transporter [Anaerolineales bacterium]|nr:AI-2E family transporter [Anaerolineales bacterium]MDP3185591.1 AI-2E family transporter [Anaerolineales bacterium]
MSDPKPFASPRWGAITKLVVALTVIAVIGALVLRFHAILAPALMAFILAYLLHPIASFLSRKTRLSWRGAVNIIYLLFIIILVVLLTLGGVNLVQQVQNLIVSLQAAITNLPAFITSLSGQIYHIGPFVLDFSEIDWNSIGQQVLSYVQPILGRLGNLVGSLASSAATTFGWMAFILLISYFFLAESGGLRSGIIKFEIPGYSEDLRCLSKELARIWNAFLRGQIIIFVMMVITYTIVFSIIGVRYAIGLALLAGFSNFLPYIGPAINWIVLGLVTFFQANNPFGLSPLAYTGIVIALTLIIDQVYASLVTPRIMAQTLKVHPAAVLIAAIIAANLLGVLGLLIAAPLLATLKLIGQYTLRKMLDKDPWPEVEEMPPPASASLWDRLRTWWQARRKKKRKA